VNRIGRGIARVVGVLAGPAWMWLARRAARAGSVVEIDALRTRLVPYFGENLVDDVEVRVVERVRTPGARIGPAGLCLGPVVVIARDVAASVRFEAVLFHELVHCVQMRRMGAAGFCGAHLAGWWAARRSYLDIPLEAEAFALQDRFAAGEVYRVEDALKRDPTVE
jgi:hypothetical protein